MGDFGGIWTAGRWRAIATAAVMSSTVPGLAACAEKGGGPRDLAGADPERGLAIIQRVGCGACHAIPGVDWPKGAVGGTLDGFGARAMISGRLPNQPETLVTYLRNPPALDPQTAMPPTPLSAADARHVAAYLYTLQ